MKRLMLITVTMAIVALAPTSARATTGSRIDGSYSVTYTREQFLAKTTDPTENNPGNWGHFKLVLRNGHFTYSRLNSPKYTTTGTYEVAGAEITLHSVKDPTEVWNFRWKHTAVGRYLIFHKLGHIGPTGFIVKPWNKTS